ncbi:MAG: 4Fe-4S binding protein [Firmicutes bacterium]|nr:4Fe-4S binding protein [Bacillota bacterium]
MSNIHEQAMQVLAILPGVDCGGCGGCGFTTCEACAEAIAKTGKITLCPACDNDAIKAIADVLGVEPVEVEQKVAFIRCAGEAAGKKRFAGLESCQAAKDAGFLHKECQWGCIGLGSCTQKCEFDAMSLVDGKVVIDKEKCTGCMACMKACPQELISMVPEDATNFIPCSSKAYEAMTLETCGHGCIGCGECEKACPQEAVKVIDHCAVIDYDKCVGCVACTVKCEKKIIVDELHDLTKVKEEIAFVKCVGGAKANAKLKALGVEWCSQAADLNMKAMGLCEYGCVGLGACTRVCRFDAISVESGVAVVDIEKCVGCGDCMRACPRDMIVLAPYVGVKRVPCNSRDNYDERLRVCDVGCIGCADCAENCPNNAIEMVAGNPVIDGEKCENCGVCSYVCSRGLIAERIVPEHNYLQVDAMKIDRSHSDERKW